MSNLNQAEFEDNSDIAVIGMSGRFPGATNVNEFWHNLRDGVESITQFTDDELRQAGVDLATLSDPNHVKAGAVLNDIDRFDAAFFGLTPREAQIMDPQQRLFLEEAWNAIERAGYNPQKYEGAIGVFAGVGLSTYLVNNLLPNQPLMDSVGEIFVVLGNDKDSLTTRVAYLLDLTGPCVTVQTYCSTSLVAISTACENLLGGVCDMALAGGVMVSVPQKTGYSYQEGGIASPDARCRAFDAKAKGSPLGNGVAVVLLKRLEDAVADGDTIHAVIKGWAVNNDGALRVGYTAPGVRGQAGVILEALANAEVDAESISYIEAHGTGTALGDAVEFQAITKAFSEHTDQKGFCAVGSVKTNIGHLDRAAGATGLIKTVLALKHQLIPPSLNYDEPNPEIDFSQTPFYVNTELREWSTSNGYPKRAGVSSFGIGGTNAHVILEQAPEIPFDEPRRPYHLFLLSAKSKTALEAAIRAQSTYLQEQAINATQEHLIADMAYTLQVGRQHFEHRCVVVCQDDEEALVALNDPARLLSTTQATQERPITFMFSGVGDHYVNMARDLYDVEPIFRQTVDHCCDILRPILGLDLREVLYSAESVSEKRAPARASSGMDLRQLLGRHRSSAISSQSTALNRTDIAQPTVFVIEYALSELLQSWGIVPDALIGYSLGEYVAACVAGVLTLKDALTLVARRAQMIQSLPTGSMLTVPLSPAEIEPYLNHEICLAIALEKTCVLAGPRDAIAQLEKSLTARSIVARQLDTSHAFHSTMMEPIVREFTALVRSVPRSKPQIPYLSNVTGEWITDAEATDPTYWAKHLCQTVRFADGLGHLLSNSDRVLLEVGAGQSLGSFAKQHSSCKPSQWLRILPTLRHTYDRRSDVAFMLETLGKLWLSGLEIDWPGFYGQERRQRIPLPTYPFERQRYWIDAPATEQRDSSKNIVQIGQGGKKADLADWFYVPKWEEKPIPTTGQKQSDEKWLIFEDELGWGTELAERLRKLGAVVIRVQVGHRFARVDNETYMVRPDVPSDYSLLLEALDSATFPTRIAHAWSITGPSPLEGIDAFNAAQRVGFYSLLYLAQAIGKQSKQLFGHEPLRITVLSNAMQSVDQVSEDGAISAEKATILGPCRTIAQEYQTIRCQSVDIAGPGAIRRSLATGAAREALFYMLIAELTSAQNEVAVAYRNGQRYVQTFKTERLVDEPTSEQLRPGGVYLITGGLGTIGLTLAKDLAQRVQAKLVLTSRSGLPARESWAMILEDDQENSPICHKIRQIQAIEKLGAEVLVMAADVSNQQQMQVVMERTNERFGTLHGVIHGAGVTNPNFFQTIDAIEQKSCQAHFLPKVHGLYVLQQLLSKHSPSLDFCLLLSSLSSVLGGLGFTAYTAANLFMDAYAHLHRRPTGPNWIAVNWDTWQAEEVQAGGVSLGATVAEFAMSLDEGVQAFALALASGKTQLINSTGDLPSRIRQWVMLESPQNRSQNGTNNSLLGNDRSQHARPALAVAYVAPSNEVEEQMVSIWSQLLGIAQIGVNDNFFELGGHSLMGTQLMSRLRQAFEVNLPLSILFDAPTVAELAIEVEIAILEEIEAESS